VVRVLGRALFEKDDYQICSRATGWKTGRQTVNATSLGKECSGKLSLRNQWKRPARLDAKQGSGNLFSWQNSGIHYELLSTS